MADIEAAMDQGSDLKKVHDAQSTMHNGKFLHNGQLLIRKDDKTYTIMGVEE